MDADACFLEFEGVCGVVGRDAMTSDVVFVNEMFLCTRVMRPPPPPPVLSCLRVV